MTITMHLVLHNNEEIITFAWILLALILVLWK